jgi:hypothetical protein
MFQLQLFFWLHCDEWDRVVALGGAFLNMVFLTTMLTTADVSIHALIVKYGIDIQIVRPEMTKLAPPSVVSGYDKRSINLNKIVATFEKHIFLSQTDLTRTGIISNSYNEMFEENVQWESKHGFLFCGNYILKYW